MLLKMFREMVANMNIYTNVYVVADETTKEGIVIDPCGAIDKIYNYFTHRKCEFAFMHCIAEYPAPMERLQLDFIDKLKKRYPKGFDIEKANHKDR